MPNNTKARSNFLRSMAEEIIKREKLDLENPPLDKRPYICEIAERGDCHIETARTVFNSVFGALRWGNSTEAYSSWGGAGRGQGRKPARTGQRNVAQK
jgi:hypothetical protein